MMDIDKLPKIDLHCHLDGSLAMDMIRNYTGQEITDDMLKVNNECASLSEYLEKFKLPLECLQDRNGLKDGAFTFIKEAAGENVKYIEVRFAPMLSEHEGLSCQEVIESVLDGLAEGKKAFGVKYNVITCAMRHHTSETNLKMLQTARGFLGQGVCAIDLAGDESTYPTLLYQELFAEAKRLELPFVIHSGETGNLLNVKYAYEFGASRVGHGIALIQDRELMKIFAQKQIGVEMCPTSNWQTKAIRNWSEYPLMDFIEAGIKVSINTDNRTVSDTTLTKELKLIHDLYQNEELIYLLLKNAQDTAFEKNLNLY